MRRKPPMPETVRTDAVADVRCASRKLDNCIAERKASTKGKKKAKKIRLIRESVKDVSKGSRTAEIAARDRVGIRIFL